MKEIKTTDELHDFVKGLQKRGNYNIIKGDKTTVMWFDPPEDGDPDTKYMGTNTFTTILSFPHTKDKHTQLCYCEHTGSWVETLGIIKNFLDHPTNPPRYFDLPKDDDKTIRLANYDWACEMRKHLPEKFHPYMIIDR